MKNLTITTLRLCQLCELSELEGKTEQPMFMLGNFSPSYLRKLCIRKIPKLSEDMEDLNYTDNHLDYSFKYNMLHKDIDSFPAHVNTVQQLTT